MLGNSRRKQASAILAAAATAALAAAASPSAAAAPSPLQQACQKGQIPADLLVNRKTPLVGPECDLRGKVIRAGFLGVEVPLITGDGVHAYASYDQTVDLATTPDTLAVDVVDDDVTVVVEKDSGGGGSSDRQYDPDLDVKDRQDPPPDSIEVKPGEPGSAGTVSTLATPPECNQTAYNLRDLYNGYHGWYIYDYNIPSYFRKDWAIADIKSGAYSIDVGRNDCGLSQSMGTDFEYRGITAKWPDINADGTCNGRDYQRTVAFWPLTNSTVLGVACVFSSWRIGVDVIVEADIAFNDDTNRFFYYLPSPCYNRYELASVAAHEFGHAFGLGHVSETYYPRMTMSPQATPCSYEGKFLGYGDWLGLRKRYGA